MPAKNNNYNYHRKTITLPDGSRKDVYGQTKAELDEKVMSIMLLVKSGVEVNNTETFGHFAKMWYKLYEEPYLRSHSKANIRNTLNRYILPQLGNTPVNSITPMQVQTVMASVAGMSHSVQVKVLAYMRSIFAVAVDNGLIARSPVSSTLKAGGEKTEERVSLTSVECNSLLEKVLNPRAHMFALIALRTGMRRGEIVALDWEHVDFEVHVIHVRNNAIMEQSGTTIEPYTKTSAGQRDIPMADDLETALLNWRKKSHSKYVIAMENHKPLTTSAYKSMWRLISREIPSKHITAHTLRHTFITRMFEAGLDIKEVQYLAGHSDPRMTMRVYTHYQQSVRAESTAKKLRSAFA